jgi:hypothetical protein
MLATQLTITLAQSLVLSTESHHDYDGSRDNDDDMSYLSLYDIMTHSHFDT